MRNYVGIAIDPTTFEEEPDELLRLEVEGFREVDLGDAKVTLMLLGWAPDKSPGVSSLRSFLESSQPEEDYDPD